MTDFKHRFPLTDISWSSTEPLTKSDVDKMRIEFWDTASAYEGHKDTWDLLKGCVELIHNGESDTAEEMLLLGGIIVPEGTLKECYNELGYKFEMPDYVLSYPTNLLSEAHSRLAEHERECGQYHDKVTVRLSDMRMFTVPVGPQDTIGLLKTKLQGPCNVPAADQRWFFGGRGLRDEVQIRRYNIDSCNIIQAVIHKPKKPDGML